MWCKYVTSYVLTVPCYSPFYHCSMLRHVCRAQQGVSSVLVTFTDYFYRDIIHSFYFSILIPIHYHQGQKVIQAHVFNSLLKWHRWPPYKIKSSFHKVAMSSKQIYMAISPQMWTRYMALYSIWYYTVYTVCTVFSVSLNSFVGAPLMNSSKLKHQNWNEMVYYCNLVID